MAYLFSISSTPPRAHGWQRSTRFPANQLPLIAPNRSIAWIAYIEQVG